MHLSREGIIYIDNRERHMILAFSIIVIIIKKLIVVIIISSFKDKSCHANKPHRSINYIQQKVVFINRYLDSHPFRSYIPHKALVISARVFLRFLLPQPQQFLTVFPKFFIQCIHNSSPFCSLIVPTNYSFETTKKNHKKSK